MIKPGIRRVVLACVTLLSSACAAPQPADQSLPAAGDTRPRAALKTLTIGYETEPLNLVIQLAGQFGSQGGTELQLAVHQRLAGYDDRGAIRPMLAAELPAQDRGTWIVNADGTMATTYKLRPNVAWHDGEPFTARDVILAWRVTSDPEIPTSQRRVSSQISGMEALDDHTLIMRWKGAYPFANVITEDDLGPLPMHLMGPLYEADKERFVQSPHWAREFVGLGPFKLTEWEPGSHMVLGANEQFWDGRPKLDRIIVRFIEDDSTAVAQMLAGTVDGDIAETIQFGQAMFVNREWEAAGRKPALVVQPTKWRFLFTQFRDPKPQELLDVRARRGLLHAIDRQTLVDALVEGRTLVSDSMIPPTDPKYDWAKDSMARYSYDVTRAEQLLAEVGWRRGPDRSLMDASGQRVTIPAWTQPGDTNGQELSIIADQWRSLGANVEESRLTTAQVRDTKYLVSFPGFVAAQIPLSFNNLMSRVNGAQCPVEETRWAGSSWGCYQNAEMDAAIRGLQGSIDFTEQQRHWRDLVRIQSQEVPVLPLYFNVTATLFREGVLGVKGHTVPKTAATWNSAEWDVAS